MADLGIGKACNSRCIMCTANRLEGMDDFDNLLGRIRSMDNPDSITITGGEPTLRKDLVELMHNINSLHPNAMVQVVTNGRLLSYSSFTQKMAKVNNLLIITELHSHDERKHDMITRSPGSFSQTLNGIKNIRSLGIDMELRIVISKINYQDIEGISKLYNELGAERVVMFPIDLIGQALKNKEQCAVSLSEMVPEAIKGLEILGKNAQLYHTPFCVVPASHRQYINKGITADEVRIWFSEICRGCRHEDYCPRVWKSYAKHFGTSELKVEN